MTTRNISISSSVRLAPIARTYRRTVYGGVPIDQDPTSQQAITSLSLVPQTQVIRKGFPYKPALHVSSDSLLSASGLYVGDNTYPWESIFEGAHSRFIAAESFWDEIGAKWTPLYSSGVNYYFSYPVLSTVPRLEEIDYQIGKQVFTTNSVRLDEATRLFSSFNSSRDDASSFMIAMAGQINSTEKASLLRVGATLGDSIEVMVDENFYLRNQYGTATLKPTRHPAKMIPFYLVLINDQSRTELRVSSGTDSNHSITIPNKDSARQLIVNIGEEIGSTFTLSFNLFEITLFPYAYGGDMTPDQIINTMSSVYGSA